MRRVDLARRSGESIPRRGRSNDGPASVARAVLGVAAFGREFPCKPRPGHAPVAFDGRHRDIEHAGDLRHRHAPEEPELDHAGHARIQRGETLERIVDLREIVLGHLGDRIVIKQGAGTLPASPLGRAAAPGVVHEDLPHRGGGEGHEVVAITIREAVTRRPLDPHPCLVHERRRLQGVVRRLTAEAARRDRAELRIQHLQKAVSGPLITGGEGRQFIGGQAGGFVIEASFFHARSLENRPRGVRRYPARMLDESQLEPASGRPSPRDGGDRDGRDVLLADWIRLGPAPCPRCRYDLSGSRGSQCPECGHPLRLQLAFADPATLGYTMVMVLLALTPGMGLLFLVGGVSAAISDGNPVTMNSKMQAKAVMAVVTAVPLVIWILLRRRFAGSLPPARRALTTVFAIVAVTEILVGITSL